MHDWHQNHKNQNKDSVCCRESALLTEIVHLCTYQALTKIIGLMEQSRRCDYKMTIRELKYKAFHFQGAGLWKTGSVKWKMAHFKTTFCMQVNQRLWSNQNSLNFMYVLVLINLVKGDRCRLPSPFSMLLLFGPACIWVVSSTALLTVLVTNQLKIF